jgi:hypothetical protein
VFAGIDAGIEQVPNFRPLVLRIPLPKTVAKAEEAFLGAGFFLVAPRATHAAVKAKLFDGCEEGGYLEAITADLPRCGNSDARTDCVLDRADDEPAAEFLRAPVSEFVQLGKMMSSVDIEERHRDIGRPEGLLRQAQQADGILAAGEHQAGPLKLGRHFAHDVNGFGFQILQMIQMIRTHCLAL